MVNKFRLFPFLQGINFAVLHLSEEPSHLLIVFFFFSLGFLWARLLSVSFVCQIYCYRFYFQRLFPIVVYCLSSLFGELTICCEMQTKLDPSYPSSICGSTPYGYPTIATQLPVPGSSVAPVNAQREIRSFV